MSEERMHPKTMLAQREREREREREGCCTRDSIHEEKCTT
jgi:hypothetical protein